MPKMSSDLHRDVPVRSNFGPTGQDWIDRGLCGTDRGPRFGLRSVLGQILLSLGPSEMQDRTELDRLKWEMLAYFGSLPAYLGNPRPFLGPWSILGRSSVFSFLGPYFRSSVGPRSSVFKFSKLGLDRDRTGPDRHISVTGGTYRDNKEVRSPDPTRR